LRREPARVEDDEPAVPRSAQRERQLEAAGRRREDGLLATGVAVQHDDARAVGGHADARLGDEDVVLVTGDAVDQRVPVRERADTPARLGGCSLRRDEQHERCQRREQEPHDPPM
jgi:hypothetical protein